MTLLGGGWSSSNEKTPFLLLEEDMVTMSESLADLKCSVLQQLLVAHCFSWWDEIGKEMEWQHAHHTTETIQQKQVSPLAHNSTRTPRAMYVRTYVRPIIATIFSLSLIYGQCLFGLLARRDRRQALAAELGASSLTAVFAQETNCVTPDEVLLSRRDQLKKGRQTKKK